jgi:small conductance mechanosensitive channel
VRISRLWKNRILLSALLALVFGLGGVPTATLAQVVTPAPTAEDAEPEAPARVDVQPVARDEEIEARLLDILTATGWFNAPEVRVQDGVVFLTGQAQTAEFKTWAGDLARNTQDVAAVVNQLGVVEPPLLDFQPLVTGVRELARAVARSIPLIIFSLLILYATHVVAGLISRKSRDYLQVRGINVLLRNVIARGIGIGILLVGLYLIFQVAGWTNIALTIVGGTGLIGLILGIAFRDITENLLASIFLSVQNPFNIGDLVEIDEVVGFVQRMTTRTTILMTLAGNHVQIPNATVYKSIIHNYTSNPNLRVDFVVGIGYDDSISLAQETVRRVLQEHPAVLNEPEHLVLVDSLGSATVNLQIYFWMNGTQHSMLKVKSSVIRLVKRAIQDAGISMPDEAREIIFPQGVPIRSVPETAPAPGATPQPEPYESDTVSTTAEGGLRSEAGEIESQARHSRSPEAGENLLKPDGTA